MSRRSKIGEIEVPEDEDADFERVMNHLGLIAYRTVLAQAGAKDVETLRDITWDELRECGLTVPVRQKVLAWQNEEVYIPRWSSGTCGCTSSRRSCAAVSLCPCYVFNIVYIEAGIQPNPCPLFGCALYLCCAPVFFSCLGCFNRQQLGVKYGIAPKYPAPSFWICVEDFCCHLLCHPCSLCQEFREVGHRNPPGRRLQSDLVEETNQDHLMAAPPPPTPDALDSDPRKWTPANLLLWLDEHHFPEVALAAASSGTTGGGAMAMSAQEWINRGVPEEAVARMRKLLFDMVGEEAPGAKKPLDFSALNRPAELPVRANQVAPEPAGPGGLPAPAWNMER